MKHSVRLITVDPNNGPSVAAGERDLAEWLNAGYQIVSTVGTGSGVDTATQRSPMRHEHRVTYTLVRSFEEFGSDAP